MKYFIKVFLVCSLAFAIVACGISEKDQTPAANVEAKQQETPSKVEKSSESKLRSDVDIIQYANKSASDLDRDFGTPVKITQIKDNPRLMPGEYREYKIAGHPKGLSVRFYKDKAKRFNLLLGTPEKSSKNALMNIFKIDVSGMNQTKTDSLSETWKGRSNGIDFKTAYAKRSKANGDFVMLHAEIE